MIYPILTKKIKWATILALFLLVLAPLILLLIRAIIDIENLQQALTLLIPRGRTFLLLAKSIIWASCVSISVTTISFYAATLLWQKRNTRLGKYRYLVIVAFAIPPYLHAATWDITLNFVKSVLGLTSTVIVGFGISWWVQVVYLLPLITGIILVALENCDSGLIAIGRTFKSDKEVFKKIVVPLIRPVIIAALIISFILTFADYTVPSLFGVNTYALEIMAEFSSSNSYSNAVLLATPLLLIQTLLLFALYKQIKGLKYTSNRDKYHKQELLFSKFALVIQRIALIILLISISLTFITSLLRIEGISQIIDAFKAGLDEIKNTININLLAVLAIGLLAICSAFTLKTIKSSKALLLILLLPFVIPQSLVGISLINFWHSILPNHIYSSILLPSLAVIMRFTTIAILVTLSVVDKIPYQELELGLIMQSPRRVWSKIIIPLMARHMLVICLTCFILGGSDLGATLLVVPPGATTLTITIYNYLHYGASQKVAALSLINLVLISLPILLIMLIRKERFKHDRVKTSE